MAPLRSSRSNRHLQQDTGPQGRIRGGVVDHDPMEGLPVRRWEKMDVTVKQDAKEDEKNDDGKDGTNTDWPWPDLPLPKDFHLLPAHSQELLRRARAPNKNPNIAVFNRDTGEYERPNLNPNNPATMTPVTKVSNFEDNTTHPSSNPANPAKDIDHDAAEHDSNVDTDKPSREESSSRTITIRRWVPLPQSIADKKPEPKYLADRRPGLPPLYGHHQTAPNPSNTSAAFTGGYAPNISSTLQSPNNKINTGDVAVGSVTVPADHAANVSGYRVLADGTTTLIGPGIQGMAGAGVQGQGETQKRRPPPPPPKRRKKGGPGRSKKKVDIKESVLEGSGGVETGGAGVVGVQPAAPDAGAGQGAIDTATEQPTATDPAQIQAQEQGDGGAGQSKPTGDDVDMGEAESSSSTEDEGGSGEGEIDEGGGGDAGHVPDLSVQVQPPSPDLLGNLESEIRGMEEGGPAA